jgi:hypothetical protein
MSFSSASHSPPPRLIKNAEGNSLLLAPENGGAVEHKAGEVDASSTAPGEPGSSDDHTIQNKSGGERPIVGDGERVIGLTDEAER